MGLVAQLAGRRVYIDTNIFIYALDDVPPFASLVQDVLDAVDLHRLHAVTSELTLCELLVVPFRQNDREAEDSGRAMLCQRPCLEVVPVSWPVLEKTARLRAAQLSLRTPDAIHLATAQLADCSVFLTNDAHLQIAEADLKTIVLSAFVDDSAKG